MANAGGSRVEDRPLSRRAAILSALLAIQSMAAVFFLIDIAGDLGHWEVLPSARAHNIVEVLAVVTLIVGMMLTAIEIRAIMRRQRRIEHQLRLASVAFFDLLEEHFDAWGLTPAERDVALLAIRGMSLAEIADARRVRTGTVKAQCAAVYAKAGVTGRPQLLSLFIDEMMDARPGRAAA